MWVIGSTYLITLWVSQTVGPDWCRDRWHMNGREGGGSRLINFLEMQYQNRHGGMKGNLSKYNIGCAVSRPEIYMIWCADSRPEMYNIGYADSRPEFYIILCSVSRPIPKQTWWDEGKSRNITLDVRIRVPKLYHLMRRFSSQNL